MNNSDSDDEDQAQLLEAIDQQFIDNIYSKVESKERTTLPSLRPQVSKSVKNELNVTPEFQNYVAKHLDHIIESQIKEIPGTSKNISCDSNENDGIRLFSKSKKVIRERDLDTDIGTEDSSRKKKKPQFSHSKKLTSEDGAEERERLREAAVSPEWVLNKEGAYGKCSEKGVLIKLLKVGDSLIEC